MSKTKEKANELIDMSKVLIAPVGIGITSITTCLTNRRGLGDYPSSPKMVRQFSTTFKPPKSIRNKLNRLFWDKYDFIHIKGTNQVVKVLKPHLRQK